LSRSLKRDIPGVDWRLSPADLPARLAAAGWEGIFAGDVPAPLRLVLEIGFGRGEFLLALAAADSKSAFLGVEYSAKRVLKMARRLARSELRNVRLLEARGELVVHELVCEGSLAECWINFPDPWPKKRHQRRRLLQPPFLRALALRLRPEGLLHLATDHVGYAEAIDVALRAEPLLENVFSPEPFLREVSGRLATAYELEWRAEGRPLHFWCYRRVAAEASPQQA